MARPLDNLCLEIDALTADIANRVGVRSKARGLGSGAAALKFARTAAVVGSLLSAGACEPSVIVGQWACPASSSDAGTAPSVNDPITVPWSTGFENRFCDYTQTGGFCVADGTPSSYRLVASPARAGSGFAAAYTVTGEGADAGPDAGATAGQARCARQGVLPKQAYYGAWYYIPATATNAAVWNLIHIQRGDPPPSEDPGIVDVSLINDATGQLRMVLHVFKNNLNQTAPVTIPIGAWFHIEVFLKRASDATGETALYQDGTRVADFANIVTDGGKWGQWFVGNFADALTPPVSTVYVDDVTISATLAKL